MSRALVGTHRRRCDGTAPVRRAGSRCTLSADSAAWLASLQSVADAYGRAEAAARADEAREAVRLRRAARDDGRAAAAALLDRDRARLLPVVELLGKRWWIPAGARIEGPKLEPEGLKAEVGFPTADQM